MSSIKWQDFLNVLTLKGFDSGVANKVKSAKQDVLKFKLCYDANISYLEEWLEDKTNIRPKSAEQSVKYRLEGNKVYQKGKDADALKLYNSSVSVAPCNTDEFALALGNRSAVLMRLNYYKEAIQDIDLALQHGDEVRRQKLLIRRALLLHRLDLAKESLQIIKSLYPNEDDIKKLDNEELKKVYYDLLSNKSDNKATKQQESLPSPKGGENKTFSSASAYISLKFSKEKGRHVVARKDLDIADIIFVEKPFALVVLPDQYDYHCHHCCKESVAFIPCQQCSWAQFCSEECRKSAWVSYHRWECAGMAICHSIGIAHLGLRVSLVADDSDKYRQVYELVTHIEDMKTEDVYQYSITAALLTVYLEKYTDYFEDHSEMSKEDMGCRILHHIAQLICNGHAITKIDSNLREKGFAKTLTEAKVRIATAIYPSVSMMNHSCDQNISHSFLNQVLVVRAMKPIKRGEEVFNCYGPHHSRMSRKERQKALKDQYFFTCCCPKCSKNSESESCQFSALKCSFCSGPVMEGEKECSDCGRPQMLVELVNMALAAQEGAHQGQKHLKDGEIDKATNVLEKSVKLASKCLYKHNADLRAYKNNLARVYSESERYKEAIEIVEDCIISIEKQFGPSSMELCQEMMKLRDLIIVELERLLSAGRQNSPEYRNLLKKMKGIMKRQKKIIEANVDTVSLSKIPGMAEAMKSVDQC